jgi:hypothetical protein
MMRLSFAFSIKLDLIWHIVFCHVASDLFRIFYLATLEAVVMIERLIY